MSPCFVHLVFIPVILHPQIDHHNISQRTSQKSWAPTKAETSLTSLVPIYLADYIHRPQLSFCVITQEMTIYYNIQIENHKNRIWNLQSTTLPFPGPKTLTNKSSGFDIWVTSYHLFRDPNRFARFCPWSKLHMEASGPASLVIWKKEIWKKLSNT